MSPVKGTESNVAVNELLEGVKPVARRVFARYRIPPHDAEDLLQEAMIVYFHKHKEVKNPRAWASGTLTNMCKTYWRTRRRKLYDAVDVALLESLGGAEDSHEKTELAMDLAPLVDELPGRCRSILSLRYGLGCQPQETAQRLGYQKSSIYKLTQRCLAALSRIILTSGLVRETPVRRYKEV